MSTQLINFTTLSDRQKEMILEWRNHPNVRAFMYNPEKISQKTHLSFIESLNNRDDKRYFLIQDYQEDIGVIDFNDITQESAVMGLYTNPYLTKKGLGTILLHAIVDYAFNNLKIHTLKAEVFVSNLKAKQLYKKFGFREVARKTIKQQDVICMEATHENRAL